MTELTNTPNSEFKEKESMSGVLIEVCIDEGIKAKGKKIFLFGTPGSLVTTKDDISFYDRTIKNSVDYIRPVIHSTTQNIAKRLGFFKFFSTSHEGCGALGLQNVAGSEKIAAVTQEFVHNNSDYPELLTHITHEPKPVIIIPEEGKPEINLGTLQIDRDENDHVHHAKRVVFTVGGFINSEEIEAINTGTVSNLEKLKQASQEITTHPDQFDGSFIVSADFLAQAINDSQNDPELKKHLDIYIKFLVKLTDTIMSNSYKHIYHQDAKNVQLEIVIFDAGRLGDEGRQNADLLKQFLKI